MSCDTSLTCRNQSGVTWKVEYLDILRDIPPSVRKEPPSSEYKSLSWKPVNRSPYNTRSRNSCQPDRTTPEETSGESSGSDGDLPSPSPAAPVHSTQGHGRNRRRAQPGRGNSQEATFNSKSSKSVKNTRQYCTIECVRGLLIRSCLDRKCPNVHEHGSERHSLSPMELIYRLHAQLTQDRREGFEQLHIRGRTGFLLKATLLSHGYTVVIEATTVQKQRFLQREIDTYRHLRPLQGYHIPVCLGDFRPRISYWYHGELMSHMMILSWSGIRMQNIINKGNVSLFKKERDRLLKVLRSYVVVHGDSEWRNILWDDSARRPVMVDFEEVTWLRKRPILGSTSGNVAKSYCSDKRKCLLDNHAPPAASALQTEII
ncbi:uncharacterized protein ASPGLDRAFT_185768 [Aspergillus glaucus CBS 516.65]|uniref:Aminoglycoside phosphotransferase domain-containing protein n=1 Tax=Aspergillus glaucus CBS 516.65 TaxID=1160497 RepID=A0A1L9VYL6_ASPGL|nr:hypothetical protein ASPGLDRAFT_185768 [Aspergillus glaucus CBS 516.65]OJJ88979.1 hypothetical protein ASPGLDRAFT_185768 [Aspergillus glaucus CBS 516.65]